MSEPSLFKRWKGIKMFNQVDPFVKSKMYNCNSPDFNNNLTFSFFTYTHAKSQRYFVKASLTTAHTLFWIFVIIHIFIHFVHVSLSCLHLNCFSALILLSPISSHNFIMLIILIFEVSLNSFRTDGA